MRILCCGDSWTNGYGVKKEEAWPNILSSITGHSVKSISRNGATNSDIRDFYINKPDKQTYDLIIFCWSGVTRTKINGKILEFSSGKDKVHLERLKYFENKSLNDILDDWQAIIDQVDRHDNIKKIHFSVFGDQPLISKDNFYSTSFLEFLAEKQNEKFKYEIPMFEFDWLSDENYNLVNKFANLYFNKDWQKAIIEREDVRPGKYFLDCGHPNCEGHKLWAEFIASKI
jgi:hypothetical protein